jgi:hypothetical protein
VQLLVNPNFSQFRQLTGGHTAVPAQLPPPCPAPDAAGLLVRFLDVGQGDAALVTTSDGRTLLVVDVVHPSAEGRDAQVMNGIEAGTSEAHNRLQSVVAARRRS